MTRTANLPGTEAVRQALELADPLGVLSVYVGAREASTPRSTALREVEVELGRVRRLVESSGTTGAEAAHAALDDVEQRVRGMTLSGQAQNLVLFAGLGQGERVTVEPPGEVPTRASFGPRADVRPLLVALDEGRPAGVALASADGVRVLEWTPGDLTEIWAEELPELEEADLVGPAHAHPRGAPGAAPGFLVGQQRDLYETRMRSELERLLLAAAKRIAELARERGWSELAVAGEDRLTTVLARGLPKDAPVEVVPLPPLERWRSDGELAQRVGPGIAGAREQRAGSRTRSALVDAKGAGRAAIGLRETIAALGDARVETLLVVAERPIAGRSSTAGVPAAPDDVPAWTAEADLADDTMLADAMIARALDTGATVVVLPERAGDVLDGEDVAALLRY